MNKRNSVNKGKNLDKSDIPSKTWYKNIMAIIAFLGAIVAAGTGALALFEQLEPEKFRQNTIILFDRSLAMNEPFGQSTKLQAAIEAVGNIGEVADADNLALRSFGGPCGDKNQNSHMDIDFSPNNTLRVKERVKTFVPQGQTTLVDGMIEALGDFSSDPERFEGVRKKIILITGGAVTEGPEIRRADSCYDDSVEYIRRRLKDLSLEEEVAISLRFIGMSLDTEEKNQLTAIARETGGLTEETIEEQLFFVESTEELESALTRIVDIEPILMTANDTRDIMNNVTDYINDAISAINAHAYPVAQESLQDASNEFSNTKLLLADYEQRLNIPKFHDEFQKLSELFNANRAIQEKQLELLEVMIDQGKRGDEDAQQTTISEWNPMVSEFNRNIREMETIIRGIVQSLRNE